MKYFYNLHTIEGLKMALQDKWGFHKFVTNYKDDMNRIFNIWRKPQEELENLAPPPLKELCNGLTNLHILLEQLTSEEMKYLSVDLEKDKKILNETIEMLVKTPLWNI